jgi:hypothetical protein
LVCVSPTILPPTSIWYAPSIVRWGDGLYNTPNARRQPASRCRARLGGFAGYDTWEPRTFARLGGSDGRRMAFDLGGRENLTEAQQQLIRRCAMVPSRFMLELTGASSGDMRLSDHAARSMI